MGEPTAREGAGGSLWLPCRTLWHREIVRFVRQRGRVVGAVGTPIVFWIMAGSGLGRSFQSPDGGRSMSYLAFTFPGAIAAILLFTAIFSTISLIDDRNEGFLQSVLVAPCSRVAIVLGKVLGATTLAVIQAGLFLLLGPLAGIGLGPGSIVATLGAMVLVAFAVTNLGFWVAWRMESTQGFHAIMNLVMIPMLVLSGAFFPVSGASSWMRWIMWVNPMTYCVSLLRAALGIGGAEGGVWPALAVSGGFAAAMFALAIWAATRETARAVH